MIRIFSAVPLDREISRFDPDPDEQHHLRVRRAGIDDPVEVLDGKGGVASGRLAGDPKRFTVEVSEVVHAIEPPSLVLLVGGGDRDRFSWLVEKGQELGVTKIVPLVTERVAGVATRLRSEHRARLERRAVEALKQSGGSWLVRIADPEPLDQALESVRAAVRWIADAEGEAAEPAGADPVAVVVGPEGGFTEAERARISRRGFRPVRLAPDTLRFETAAIAAAAWITASRGRRT